MVGRCRVRQAASIAVTAACSLSPARRAGVACPGRDAARAGGAAGAVGVVEGGVTGMTAACSQLMDSVAGERVRGRAGPTDPRGVGGTTGRVVSAGRGRGVPLAAGRTVGAGQELVVVGHRRQGTFP